MKLAKPKAVTVATGASRKSRLASKSDREMAAQFVRDYLAYTHGRNDIGGNLARQVDGDELAAYLTTLANFGTFTPGAALNQNLRTARISARFERLKSKGKNVTELIDKLAQSEHVSEDTVKSILYRKMKKPDM